MISYLGSRGERIPLLVDTMADGTAIKYEIDQSSTKIQHLDDPGQVQSFENSMEINGYQVSDDFCISDFFRRPIFHGDRECVDQYEFLLL
jgi:hypothetical protein